MKLYLVILASLIFNSYGASQGNKKQAYKKHQIFMVPELLSAIASKCSSLEELDDVVGKLVILGNNSYGQIYNNGLSLIALYLKNQLGESFDEAKFLSEADNLRSESFLKYVKPMMSDIIYKNLHALHTLLIHIIFKDNLNIIPKWLMPISKYDKTKIFRGSKSAEEVLFIEISNDNSFIVIGFDCGRIEIRSKKGDLLNKIKIGGRRICAYISEDSSSVTIYSWGKIDTWDRKNNSWHESKGFKFDPRKVFVRDNKTTIIYKDRGYQVLDGNGNKLYHIDNPSSGTMYIDISRDNKFIVVGSDKHIRILDINGNIRGITKFDSSDINCVYISNDNFLFIGFYDGSIIVYDIDSNFEFYQKINFNMGTEVNSISKNGNIIAIGYEEHTIIATIGGKILHIIPQEDEKCIRISNDGSFIVIGGIWGIVRILSRPVQKNTEKGKCSVM